MRRFAVYLLLMLLISGALTAGWIASDWPHWCRTHGWCASDFLRSAAGAKLRS